MSTHIQPLIEQTHPRSAENPQALAQLSRTLQHHAPDAADMREAIATGRADVVKVLLEGSKLDSQTRATLSTAGLLAWSANPLASREAQDMVACLARWADVGARSPKGETVAEVIAPMLGNIEHEEAALSQKHGRPYVTAAGDTLRSAWRVIQGTGHDMASAARLRQPSATTVEKWRRDRAQAEQKSALAGPRPTQ